MIAAETLRELLAVNGLALYNQRNKRNPAELLSKAINKHLKAAK